MIGSQQGESVNVSSSSMATQPSFQKLQILLVVVLCDTQRVLHAMQWSLQNNEMIQKNLAKDETNNDAPNEIATAQAVATRCIACVPRSWRNGCFQACTSDALVSVGTSILLHAYRTADRQLIVSNQSRISASSAEAIKARGAHSLDEIPLNRVTSQRTMPNWRVSLMPKEGLKQEYSVNTQLYS